MTDTLADEAAERRRSDLPEDAPDQYAVGEPCRECRRPLSRYNPYVVCGPCRVRLTTVTEDFIEDDEPDRWPVVSYVWERFAKRKPVRRGSLLEIEA